MSTHNIPFYYKKENLPGLSQICRYGNFSLGLKNGFETAVENEPSVFELYTAVRFWPGLGLPRPKAIVVFKYLIY